MTKINNIISSTINQFNENDTDEIPGMKVGINRGGAYRNAVNYPLAEVIDRLSSRRNHLLK